MKITCILLLSIGTLFSCSQQHSEETSQHTVHAAPTELSLNGNERWQADEATNGNIKELQLVMQEHLKQPDTNNLEAVNELGSTLQLGFDVTFKECRMQGPEHDMLHTYLMPMLEDVQALQARDLATAVAARNRLSERLSQYETYFK